ncbi:MAG: hydrolase 1, exosortase A system-associated [Cytophaga sp.]|nr:hydrolase 1, exosortase A system-associated [Undibacterium sp.]
MHYEEQAFHFPCKNAALLGIVSMPQQARARGILFVVGGPQYRAGSHRQFTLLARQFASNGIPAMRFDYRGMGDSEGEARDFNAIDDDIRSAIDSFFQHVPGMTEVVLWGLCDAASAALFYAHQDSRITGLVLLNPWIRTEHGAAKAYLKHYYLQRLMDGGFWKKIIAGDFALFTSMRSFLLQIGKLFAYKGTSKKPDAHLQTTEPNKLPEKMLRGLQLFKGKTLFILCSDDLTAQEFSDLAAASPTWKTRLSSSDITRRDLPDANHTFSQRRWREQIGQWTIDWIHHW